LKNNEKFMTLLLQFCESAYRPTWAGRRQGLAGKRKAGGLSAACHDVSISGL
jgi:hypothetical protein